MITTSLTQKYALKLWIAKKHAAAQKTKLN
jgi:hypothetical protein